MAEPESSYRQILRSTSIVGGASVLNILIGLVRVKLLAVLLGPAGVGLAGLYTNLMSTVTVVAGLGLSNSGVRQIAEAGGNRQTLSRVRQALWYANLILGMLGLLLLWTVREPVSRWVFDDTTHATAVGWLGVGVMLSLIAGMQTALLQGLRRIGDMAWASIAGALLGTLAGLGLIKLIGQEGVLAYVLAGPAMSVVAAWYFVSKLPRSTNKQVGLAELTQQWRIMLGLGIVFMATGLMNSLTQLVVRSLISHDLGLEETGYFQAAWTISMTYLGFVLGAMGADYYPRLTEVIQDRARANQMVNEQTRVALLLAGPVLLGMITFAPLVVNVLYSEMFSPSVEILRWQALGDLFKVVSWPMAFILLARREGRLFFLTELAGLTFYVVGVWLGLSRFGLITTGVVFFLMYVMYFIMIYIVVTRINRFRWDGGNFMLFCSLVLCGVVVQMLSWLSFGWTYFVGSILLVTFSCYSLYYLNRMIKMKDRLGWLTAWRTIFKRKGLNHG